MKKNRMQTVFILFGLIALTCAAMAYANLKAAPWHAPGGGGQSGENSIVRLDAKLVQDKIFSGGDRIADLSLTLKVADVQGNSADARRNVDMVIVLDRSGSMSGDKIADARQAIMRLLTAFGTADRFSLISYANDVKIHSPLVSVDERTREDLRACVAGLPAGGGTFLSGGLAAGVQMLQNRDRNGNIGKMLLISDGLANHGITDPAALGEMAAMATGKGFSVSTVGVGSDFNEQLMTALADHGGGYYHYLENPDAFAAVFENEYRRSRAVAATGMAVTVPLPDGVSLSYAGGYPFKVRNGEAIFHPGDLLSASEQTLFLKFVLPPKEGETYIIENIHASYYHGDTVGAATLAKPLHITCIGDSRTALASIDKSEWSRKVVEDEYSQLKEAVSADIKEGKKEAALSKIDHYYNTQQSVNATVGSTVVAEKLDSDLTDLRATVEETFRGAPAAVALKQKKNAKSLQFEGYKARRQSKVFKKGGK